MNNLMMIVKNNIKKQKGDMITFLIMTLIASFLIFNALADIMGLEKVLDKRAEEVNIADLMVTVRPEAAECLEEVLGREAIEEYEKTEVLKFFSGYRAKGDEDFSEFGFIAEYVGNDRDIMKIVPEGTELKDDGILIPYSMSTRFNIGDVIEFKIDDDIYELEVEGFTEDPWFCSTMNIAMYHIYLSEEMMEEFGSHCRGDAFSVVEDFLLYECIVSEDGDPESIEMEVTDEFENVAERYRADDPAGNYEPDLTVSWVNIRMGDMIFPTVVSAVMLLFAIIILVISLIIITFSINNFIRSNMKNTGILEACGYTTRELRNALTLQITGVAAAGTLGGVLIAALAFRKMGTVFGLVLGLPWNVGPAPVCALITVAMMIITIFLTSRVLSRKYEKITVLDALRGGITNHSFKRDHFPLDRTRLPLPLTLSFKEIFGSVGKNIAIMLIVAVLTVSALLGIGMMDNFGADDGGIFEVMGFEYGDMMVTAEDGHGEEFSELKGVDNVYTCQEVDVKVRYGEETCLLTAVSVDDLDHARHTVMIDGRKPVSDNEIMLTWAAAKDLNVTIGDVVTLISGSVEKDFIVVGLDQRMLHAGRSVCITLDGLSELGARGNVCKYYITSEEGVSYEELEKTMKEYSEETGLLISCANSADFLDGALGDINGAIKSIAIVLSLLTVVIVAFVESLVIRAKISREWRGMGINKALGMSSGDLLAQISFSNIPTVAAGAVLGAALSGIAGTAVIKAVFSYMGIKAITFAISFDRMAAVFAGVVLIAYITSALAGLKVRRIIPMEMITEE